MLWRNCRDRAPGVRAIAEAIAAMGAKVEASEVEVHKMTESMNIIIIKPL